MKKANQSDILGELLKKPGGAARPTKSEPIGQRRAQGVTCTSAPEETAAPTPQDPAPKKTATGLAPLPREEARDDRVSRTLPQDRSSTPAVAMPWGAPTVESARKDTTEANQHETPIAPKSKKKAVFDTGELLSPKKHGISTEKDDPVGAVAPLEETRETKPTEPTSSSPKEPDLDLLGLLQALLKRSGFTERDEDLLGALLWSLSHNENVKRPRSKWVVLHREGPDFAKVTSQEELSRVARNGDIVLLLPFLQTMLHQRLPAAVLTQFRAWTDPLLKDTPDMLLLQALGLNTLKWCLKNRKAPVDAWTVVCHKVTSAADEKILLANRLEMLNRILAA